MKTTKLRFYIGKTKTNSQRNQRAFYSQLYSEDICHSEREQEATSLVPISKEGCC